jgi:HEAT repeat protein
MRQTVALSLLSQPSATDRLQGISYTAAVRNPSTKTLAALVETLNTDPNPNVRLAAVEALYLFRNQPGVRDSLVASLAVQDSALVQVALIDLLVEIREERASEALKSLIKNEKLNPDVKKLAEQGIKQLI